MLSNAYFLANIGFDTAENEPAKILLIYNILVFNLVILLILRPIAHCERRLRIGERPIFLSSQDAAALRVQRVYRGSAVRARIGAGLSLVQL